MRRPLPYALAALGAVVVMLFLSSCGPLAPHIGQQASSAQQPLGGATTVPPMSSDPTVQLLGIDADGAKHVVDCVRVLQPSQYTTGLSGSAAVHGAVFKFDPPGAQSFWMKNTPTRLVIFWIGASGDLLGQEVMLPNTTNPYSPPAPISEAVELPAPLTPRFGVQALSLGSPCTQS